MFDLTLHCSDLNFPMREAANYNTIQYTCMHLLTCCLAIMGRMTSAICLDNLFHLSSFSLWHCCSTRMNISNTWSTHVKANVRQRRDQLEYFYICMLWQFESIDDYLMVLHKSEQHGNNHFFLCIQFFACICFVWASQHKQVMNYWLQGWDGCRGRRRVKYNYFRLNFNLHNYQKQKNRHGYNQCPLPKTNIRKQACWVLQLLGLKENSWI